MDVPAVCAGAPLRFPDGFPDTVAEALRTAAAHSPDAGTVTVDGSGHGELVSYPRLLERARRLATALRGSGSPGDPVVVYARDPADLITGFWGGVYAGVPPLLLARPAGPDTETAADRLRHATRLLGEPLILARPDELPPDGRWRWLDPDTAERAAPAGEAYRPEAGEPALLLMSSGSTGAGKLIPLTHHGLREFAAGTAEIMPLRPGDTSLNWMPLDGSGSFLLYHLYQVYGGTTNVHASADWVLADPLRWLDLIAAHRVAHAWAPNFAYRLVSQALRDAPGRGWDLSSVRTLVSGGEQITVPVMEGFFDAVAGSGLSREVFVPAWGMTETCTAATHARYTAPGGIHHLRAGSLGGDLEWLDGPGEDAVSLVSVGAPAPGITVRIVDERHRRRAGSGDCRSAPGGSPLATWRIRRRPVPPSRRVPAAGSRPAIWRTCGTARSRSPAGWRTGSCSTVTTTTP
ncbi:MAG: AMP-binding protein [Micromonosporaceae bacterium]